MATKQIAIDGYSSCGKSTLARHLAAELGFAYIDTGAMYRAVTLYILQNNIPARELSREEMFEILNDIIIEFRRNPRLKKNETYLNGKHVEEAIRGRLVSEKVSEIAQIKSIRERMVKLQQQIGERNNVVMDGRDIGTQVFPNADLKLFMTADPEVRAQRRYQELKNKGQEVALREVKANLSLRDYQDTHRKENPLKQAEDAVVIDTTKLSEAETLQEALRLAQEKGIVK